MDPKSYATIADQMLRAATDPTPGLTAETIAARVMHLGCMALDALAKDLSPDGEITWARRHLNGVEEHESYQAALFDSPATSARRRQMREFEQSTRQLFDAFLVAETSFFEKAGVPPDLRRYIAAHAQEFKHEYWNVDLLRDESWQGQQQVVSELAGFVCRYSVEMRRLDVARKFLRKGALFLSGGAVILLNSSVDAITLGLPPWMTVKSGKLGAWLMKKAGVDGGNEA